MVGKYEIKVYNNKVQYKLTIKRNITILQGNSATGKTELIRLISEYEANDASSGITLICDKKCTVLTSVDWELRLSSLKEHIIFIDETANFIKSKRFAELVKGSDNYFVIVTRDDLSQLPYSVEEIYGLKNASDNQKHKNYTRIYNEMYKLYCFDVRERFDPDVVITEDSNSGYELFSLLYLNRCISANGKSNIYQCIKDTKQKQTLAIVDGAAFGSEIGKIYRYIETSRIKCVLYAPESFEYLLLRAGFVDITKDKIENTFNYADSMKYMSWEEYYTEYLLQETRDTVYQYKKTKLASAYKTETALTKILSVIPNKIIPNNSFNNKRENYEEK
jgi:hypothetical protein